MFLQLDTNSKLEVEQNLEHLCGHRSWKQAALLLVLGFPPNRVQLRVDPVGIRYESRDIFQTFKLSNTLHPDSKLSTVIT